MCLVGLQFPNCALRQAVANSQEHKSTNLYNYIKQPALDIHSDNSSFSFKVILHSF